MPIVCPLCGTMHAVLTCIAALKRPPGAKYALLYAVARVRCRAVDEAAG